MDASKSAEGEKRHDDLKCQSSDLRCSLPFLAFLLSLSPSAPMIASRFPEPFKSRRDGALRLCFPTGFLGRVWPRSAAVTGLCACAGSKGTKVKMAAARAGVLGVRWLRRASRNVVPFGARSGPRERARPQRGNGVPEGWCVGGRAGLVDTAAEESRLGVEVVHPAEKQVENLAGPWKSWALASAATAS